MHATRGVLTVGLLLGLLFTVAAIGVDVGRAQATHLRWDIVSLPGGGPTLLAGGVAYAKASDGSIIQLTGSGTFDLEVSFLVEGGGTWTTYNSDENVTGQGTYRVTGLVRFDGAPGSLPPGVDDRIGALADARAGLAILEIRYNDGSEGILIIGCRLVGTSASVGEGIAVTKGVVSYSRVDPIPGVDANRTVFHVGF
jgi:hypothetical protein